MPIGLFPTAISGDQDTVSPPHYIPRIAAGTGVQRDTIQFPATCHLYMTL